METEGHYVAFSSNKGDVEVASLHEVKTKKTLHSQYIKLSLHPLHPTFNFTFLKKKKQKNNNNNNNKTLTATVDKYDIISVILFPRMEDS